MLANVPADLGRRPGFGWRRIKSEPGIDVSDALAYDFSNTIAVTPPLRRLVIRVAGAVLGDALWFVPSYSEKVVVNGEIANRYALGPSRRALFGTGSMPS